MDIMTSPQVTRARVAAESRLDGPATSTHTRAWGRSGRRRASRSFRRSHWGLPGGGSLAARHRLCAVSAVTGFHPVDGAVFARREGFDELVVSLVAFHSGAPAEARERGINGLSAFSEPPQQVLDALTFCDLTTGPDGSAVSPRDRLAGGTAALRPG